VGDPEGARMTTESGQNAIWVEITATRGSTPRDSGTAMQVTAMRNDGTIGGGALEHQAIALARAMLGTDATEMVRRVPLGPGLGQCCGGAVTLRFTREPRPIDVVPFHLYPVHSHQPHPAFLWLWGAGHVGRAVVRACPPQPFRITWIDEAADRFPDGALTTPRSGSLTTVPAADMPRLAAHAPIHAHHLIFTYSHQIDLALCAALLRRGAASIGLIGSQTKKARFWNRLRAMGLDPTPITCPIGDRSLGKAPEAIARGTIAAMLAVTEQRIAS